MRVSDKRNIIRITLIITIIGLLILGFYYTNHWYQKDGGEIDEIIARTYGNENSDIVVVYSQGGPSLDVEMEVLEELQESSGKIKDVYFVQPHQIQTLQVELFEASDITFEDAIKYDEKSVDYLAKVVKYYKNKGKEVYVVGISFGAFVTQKLIADYGVEIADGFAIMVGRLNIEEKFWTGFSQGKCGYYINGVEPILEETDELVDSNTYKLAAGIGYIRFMTQLDGMNLNKVTYSYGKLDEAVGRLSDAELKFLTDHGAKIFPNEGGHGDASTDETDKMIEYLLNVK